MTSAPNPKTLRDVPILFSAPMVRAIMDGSKTQTRRALKPQPIMRGADDCVITYERGAHTFSGPPEFLIGDIMPKYGCRWRVGDRLWVRETYFQFGHWEPVTGQTTRKTGRQKWRFTPDNADIAFDPPASHRKGRHAADPATPAWHKRLGRFMPRSASRTTLEVTAVRVERLQDISEADALAEGVEPPDTEREDHDWSICPQCGGTGLYNGLGANYGVMPDCDCYECDTAVKRYKHLWNHINGAGAWDKNPYVSATTFRRVPQP